MSTYFGIKSEELYNNKNNRIKAIENGTVSNTGKKMVFYANLTNYSVVSENAL